MLRVSAGLTKEPLGCLARYSASRSSSSDAASTAVAGRTGAMAALNISLTVSGVAPASPLRKVAFLSVWSTGVPSICPSEDHLRKRHFAGQRTMQPMPKSTCAT